MDNGTPWATCADLPPALPLWWLGLGIEPIWNRPRCPQQNPFVERCHGLVEPWGEPGTCPDFPTWQTRMAWVATLQRERYPAVQGRTRLEAYPELQQNPRRYRASEEAAQFALPQVTAYLAQGRWPRLVSKIGQITLYGQAYRVGRRWVGQQVWLRLDAAATEWVVEASDGHEIIRHPAEQLTRERIIELRVAHPRPLSKKAHARRNLSAQ